MRNNLNFQTEQFNRIFPFYLLIDRKMNIVAHGTAIGKICNFDNSPALNKLFFISRPATALTSFEKLLELNQQLVVLECTTDPDIKLRGQVEFLSETEEILFIGSPWFRSIEEIKARHLVINDFAPHDPLIDMLHLLKTQEIINDDLKEMVGTINTQKKALKQAYKDIHDIALFPKQNPDPLIRIDMAGNLLTINPSGEQLSSFEYERQQYTAPEFFTLLSSLIDNQQERWIIEARSGNKHFSFVCKTLLEEGYINIYGRDITEQKRNEQELKRLSLVASANKNGIIFTKTDGKIFWVNEGFSQLTGYTLNEAEGISFRSFCKGGNDLPDPTGSSTDCFNIDTNDIKELQFIRKEGSRFWGRTQWQAVNDEHERISYYFAMIEDITAEKAVQRKLKDYEDQLKMALTNVGDNFWEHDFLTGKTVFSNPDNHLFGFTLDEDKDIAAMWWSRVHPDDIDMLYKNDAGYRACIIDQHTIEYRVIHQDGNIRWVLDRGRVSEKDSAGNPLKIIGTHIDITRQKSLELELVRAREKAEDSTRAKQAFLSNMSHEIRTPMNGIIGMANHLSKTELDVDQHFYLNTIQTAADHLLVVINDILDLSKIEAGKMTIENIGFDLKATVERAMQVMQYKAEEKGLQLKLSFCDKSLASCLMGDPHRINQVLLNLLSNAVKFTEKGGIDIMYQVLADQSEEQKVRILIKDTGIGMDDAYVNNLFLKFSQEDETITRRFGGTGLGMSISKQLIELMGGTIEVQSRKGVGTMISCTLTLKKGTIEQLPVNETAELSVANFSGKKILIVDDNEMNRLVARTILADYGASIMEAINGKEAIQKIKEEDFDVVLMDVQMPEMDGLEATRIIRAEISQQLPIIALTALALKSEKEKILATGMNDYISKPFKEKGFTQIISKWLNKKKEMMIMKESMSNRSNLYDLTRLYEISGGSEGFIQKMLGLFIQITPVNVEEMEQAYQRADYSQIKKIAHQIKSVANYLHITELNKELLQMDWIFNTAQAKEQLPGILKRIKEVVQQVVGQIKANHFSNPAELYSFDAAQQN